MVIIYFTEQNVKPQNQFNPCKPLYASEESCMIYILQDLQKLGI